MLSTLPCRRRVVDCRYGLCNVGSREYFRLANGRLQIALEERARGRRGGRAQDTNMVIRRVSGIVVTVKLALIIVVPLRLI